MSNPNAVSCLLCGQELEEPNLRLELHILSHRVQPGNGTSDALSAALNAFWEKDDPKEEDLSRVVKMVRAEERLRMQTLIKASEDLAIAAGRVSRRYAGTGPTFWYDL